MSYKKFSLFLIGLIVALLLFMSYAIHNKRQVKTSDDTRVNDLISIFEKKFKRDSLDLVKSTNLLIDNISQHIIDSVSSSFEEKLAIILMENKKYKNLLIANNIKIDNRRTKKSKIKLTSKNKRNSSSRNKAITSNVTSYTKLPGYARNQSDGSSQKSRNKYSSNVISYKELNSQDLVSNNYVKKASPKLSNIQTNNRAESNKGKKVNHNNYDLDHSTNLNDIEFAPIYPGCEPIANETDKKNCFSIKISQYILRNFNSSVAKNIYSTKGKINKLRVLFIIDENGRAKASKIVGKWDRTIKKEVFRVITSIPKMKPGVSNGINTKVKYSMLIPFIVE